MVRGKEEGDLDAVANGTNPSAGDALRAAEQPSRRRRPPLGDQGLQFLPFFPGQFDTVFLGHDYSPTVGFLPDIPAAEENTSFRHHFRDVGLLR